MKIESVSAMAVKAPAGADFKVGQSTTSPIETPKLDSGGQTSETRKFEQTKDWPEPILKFVNNETREVEYQIPSKERVNVYTAVQAYLTRKAEMRGLDVSA